MRTRRRFITYLLFLLLSLTIIIFVIFFINPSKDVLFLDFAIHPVLIFFILIFLAIYFLFSYILLNKREGTLLSIFILVFFILRYLGITSPVYLVLLFIILFLIEWLYKK